MLRRVWVVVVALVLVAGACGGGDDDAEGPGAGDAPASDGPDQSDEADGDPEADNDATDNNATGDNATDNNATGDDDDLGDITGTDVDPDDLGEVGDLADDIDDIVSLGDCVIETLGLGAVAPEGMQCRVLDNPIPGFDGFTMFAEGNVFAITFASRTPIRPCDISGICENPVPVEIPGFSDAVVYETFGTGNLFGASDSYEVDLVVSRTTGALTDDDLAVVRAAAESFGPA